MEFTTGLWRFVAVRERASERDAELRASRAGKACQPEGSPVALSQPLSPLLSRRQRRQQPPPPQCMGKAGLTSRLLDVRIG